MDKKTIVDMCEVLFLRKLFGKSNKRVGGKHLPKQFLLRRLKDLTKEEQKIGKKVYKNLVNKKRWIIESKHKYGMGASLNPEFTKEIKKKLIEK